MSNVLRFKASLTTGYWDGNPEKLVRDPCGDYCLFSDYKKLQAENAELFRLKEVFKARNNKALDYLYEESQDSAYDARCALEGE